MWKRDGIVDTTIELQIEVVKQAFANIAFLVLPALYIGNYGGSGVHVLEIAGFSLTVLAYLCETTADF